MLARLEGRSNKAVRKKVNRLPEIASGSLLLCLKLRFGLSGAGDFRCFGINTPTVERIVDDFSDGGNIRIDVHSIASCEMTNNPLGSYLKHRAGQLRKTPRLNVIDSLKPLSQRQALIEIHDLIFSPS